MTDVFRNRINAALLAARPLTRGKVTGAVGLRVTVSGLEARVGELLQMGEGTAASAVVRQAARAGRPIFEAHAEPSDRARFAGGRFLAFAGIGHPEKFFDTVRQAGGAVALSRAFPDHHF